MESKINIAIDGPVGCGKSTTAKELAKKLEYKFLDTGAMYRAIGYYFHSIKKILPTDVKTEDLSGIEIGFDENNEINLNGINIESEIRTATIGRYASDYGTVSCVRKFLSDMQKEIVKDKGYIAEGRDIGSVVIPDAEVKIFLTASVDERAKRRLTDFKEKGNDYSLDEVKRLIEDRDFQDINRKESPLIKCDDAIEIDTSDMSIEQQVEKIYKIAIEKIEENWEV